MASVRQPGEHRVYNLEVETEHVYYVGVPRLLVHNGCGAEGGKGGLASEANGAETGAYVRSDAPPVQRKLPSTTGGDPVPDTDVPHTQLGRNAAGEPAAREWMFKEDGETITATRRIDFSDHGTPQFHPNPHQHRLIPNNAELAPRGGYRPAPAEPLD